MHVCRVGELDERLGQRAARKKRSDRGRDPRLGEGHEGEVSIATEVIVGFS